MAIGTSDFTPVQDYTPKDARRALVMLTEYAENGSDEQIARAIPALSQLSGYLNLIREKQFDRVAEVQFKSAMNRVMRYAESVIGINLSKYESVLGDEYRQFSQADVIKARQLIMDAVDDQFHRQSIILTKEELSECDQETLQKIEDKIGMILSANTQLERAIKGVNQEHFDDLSKFHSENALQNALYRIDLAFRKDKISLGEI